MFTSFFSHYSQLFRTCQESGYFKDLAFFFGGGICRGGHHRGSEKAEAAVAELQLKGAAKKAEDGIEETLTYADFPSEHWTP